MYVAVIPFIIPYPSANFFTKSPRLPLAGRRRDRTYFRFAKIPCSTHRKFDRKRALAIAPKTHQYAPQGANQHKKRANDKQPNP
jgi:hypothetical protein